MARGQNVYALSCHVCGGVAEVVNPRLDEEPYEVSRTEFDMSLTDREKVVRTRCSNCGRQIWARFKYR